MKKIIEFTAIITSFIIFCGYIKLFIFYKGFGILISQFVEIQEVLTYFLENLIGYFIVVILTVINLYFLFQNKNDFSNWNIKTSIKYQRISWLLFILIIPATFAYYKLTHGVDKTDLVLLLLLFFICIILIPFLFGQYKKMNKNLGLDRVELTTIFLCSLLLGFAILNGFNEKRKVLKTNNIFTGTEIKWKEKNFIVSNDSITFVGMTKSYFFIYNKFSKFCTAYKTEDLESIKFKKK